MPRSHAFNSDEHVEGFCLMANDFPANGTLATKIDARKAHWGQLIVAKGDGDHDATYTVMSSASAAGPFTNLLDSDGNTHTINVSNTDDDTLKEIEFSLRGADRYIDVQQTLNSGSSGRSTVVMQLWHPRRSEDLPLSVDQNEIGFS